MIAPLLLLSSVATPHPHLYLQQLHDEYKRLRGFHQLIKLRESGGVIVEQISHPTRVLLAFQGVFPLSDEPHSLRDDGVQACVLQRRPSTSTSIQLNQAFVPTLSIFSI